MFLYYYYYWGYYPPALADGLSLETEWKQDWLFAIFLPILMLRLDCLDSSFDFHIIQNPLQSLGDSYKRHNYIKCQRHHLTVFAGLWLGPSSCNCFRFPICGQRELQVLSLFFCQLALLLVFWPGLGDPFFISKSLRTLCVFWFAYIVSKVGDCSRGQPEGSLFNCFYAEM